MMMNKLFVAYKKLLSLYDLQGWWPIDNIYHPNDYSYPHNNQQIFEICVGAILTQNTSWNNVEKALNNLRKEKLLDARKIVAIDEKRLALVIKPAGYFNQKTKKLKIFSQFFGLLKGQTPSRNQLLELWGIGPETADSILLYAYNKPEFVVDAYTRRFLIREKFFSENEIKKLSYDHIKSFFVENIPRDDKTIRIYNEYHALIVADEKNRRYNKK
jgi:endonuclease-3 related protein